MRKLLRSPFDFIAQLATTRWSSESRTPRCGAEQAANSTTLSFALTAQFSTACSFGLRLRLRKSPPAQARKPFRSPLEERAHRASVFWSPESLSARLEAEQLAKRDASPPRHSSTQPVRQGQDCDFSAFVALRDEGLHPKLRELFERAATFPFSDVSVRSDGMLQAGPNPRSGKDGSSGIAISFPRETCPEAVERELEKRP